MDDFLNKYYSEQEVAETVNEKVIAKEESNHKKTISNKETPKTEINDNKINKQTKKDTSNKMGDQNNKNNKNVEKETHKEDLSNDHKLSKQMEIKSSELNIKIIDTDVKKHKEASKNKTDKNHIIRPKKTISLMSHQTQPRRKKMNKIPLHKQRPSQKTLQKTVTRSSQK